MSPILVTCYVNADLDGYAGVVAYAEFLEKNGQNALAGVIGQPHDEVKYVLTRFGLAGAEIITDDQSFNEVILVDASDLNGLEGKIEAAKVKEIIDHRQVNEADKFPNAKTQIELVGAAATLIAEKFKQADIPISKRSALLIYSAIISNTLNFKGSVTTERDKKMAAWLRQFIEVSDDYWRELFSAKSDLSGEKLASRIKRNFAWVVLGGERIGISQLEIIGAAELVRDRGEEIIVALNKIKTDLNLDFVFQNIIELELGKNYLVADDDKIKAILAKVLGLKFNGIVAQRDKLIMRKQIIPLIKEELENKS